MAASNIERFDSLVVRILGALYEQFPVPINILAKDYVDNPAEFNEHIGADVLSAEAEFLNHTLNWLKHAGYIDFQDVILQLPGGAGSVVLTAKALETLRAMPESVEQKITLGDQLRSQAKAGSTEAMKTLVGEVIRLGILLIR